MATAYGHEALSEITSNYPEYDDLDEGKTVKVNHSTCTAGVDKRKRFGLKRVDDAYLYHCFNCGDSGYFRPRETLSRMSLMTGVDTRPVSKEDCIKQYYNAEANYNNFDIRGQLWLGQYGFDYDLCIKYGIKETSTGIILPIHSATGLVQDYQVRRYSLLPKYVTHRTNKNAQVLNGWSTKPVVVVEDLLSSYKLHSVGFTTICLMGTSFSKTTLVETGLDRTQRVVLWLDDDAAGHAGAAKLYRELSPMFLNSITSINMQQPKEIDMNDLLTMEL